MTTAATSAPQKKPSVALRDSTKLQLIHRNNSQASGISVASTERAHHSSNHHQSVLLSQRGNQMNTQPTSQLESGRNSIATNKRRQQQTSQHAELQQQQLQQEQPACLRDFHVHKKIGVGAYSEVYQVTRKSDGMAYALKQVKIQRLTEKEKQNALNEVRILASINNKNVIAYKDTFFDEASSTLCIVMEFADSGDLYGKIMEHQKNATEFSEQEIWDALVQMTQGLKALHDRNIFHRDLKSANIFQNSDGTFKMGDLNVSKIAQDGMLYTQTGTPYYASPEVWQEKPYDNKSDIWSLGCILYEMCSLNPPFRAKSMKGLYNSVLSGMYPKLPQHYSEEMSAMIKILLAVNPTKRPSCEQLLSHELIQKARGRLSNSMVTMSEQDKSTIQDQLLQTIHCPRNLSQLSQILPRSKYQSGVNNQNTSSHLELPTNIQQAPSTAATVDRKRKRRQNTSEVPGDRNNIIELAQQIVLPPIRESDSGCGLTMLQQQQQRQMELLGLRRKTNGATGNGKAPMDSSRQHKEHTRSQRPSNKIKKQPSDQQYAEDGHTLQQSADLVRTLAPSRTGNNNQQEVIMTNQSQAQNQNENKKKIKSQLQIRQQIGRVAQKEAKSYKKQQQNNANNISQNQSGIGQSQTLASYPMDIANTLAAQNLQMMENYSSSLIDLPPSIDNIYATNDAINLASRFNQPSLVGSVPKNGPNSQHRLQEHAVVNQSTNQQITSSDLNTKQSSQKYFPQMPSLQRNNSQHRGIELKSGPRWNHLNQQDVYASQSNLVTTNKQMPPGAASANRYQSVGMINLPRDGSGGVSTTATSNQGAAPGPSQQIHSGSGSTSLPGLKQNLQSMKSAKQLQKFTPQDQLMNSMKVRQSVKKNLLQQETAYSIAQSTAPVAQYQDSVNANPSTLKAKKENSHAQTNNEQSQASLPPRQPSTTRNGAAPTRNQGSKLRSSNNINLSQRSLNTLRQASQHQPTRATPAQQQQYSAASQATAVGMSNTAVHNESIRKTSPYRNTAGESGVCETPATNKLPNMRKVSPTKSGLRGKQTAVAVSQRQLRETENGSSSTSNLLRNGIGLGQVKKVQASVDGKLRGREGADLAQSFNHRQPSKNQKYQEWTQSMQPQHVSRDKSQIMVELMPLQKNSGRASTKMQTGRNHFENFSANMERLTAGQESLRINQKSTNTYDESKVASNLKQIQSLNPDQSNLPVNGIAESSRQDLTQTVQKQESVRDDMLSPQQDSQQQLTIQEKRSQLKQLRMQQQRISNNNKKVRQSKPIDTGSPSNTKNFTKAQYLENKSYNQSTAAAQNQSLTQTGNPGLSGKGAKLGPADLNSFEAPKQSHRILPVPQLEMKKYSHNANMGLAKNRENGMVPTTSSSVLPSLKNYLDGTDVGGENKNGLNYNSGSGPTNNNTIAASNRVDTQQYERSKQILMEAGGQSSVTNSSLEQKQQYLEQLRQLASMRHQKKNSSLKTNGQSSVKTKKNGGNKAAAVHLTAHTQQASPSSSKLSGILNRDHTSSVVAPFYARSSVPKLPSCQDNRAAVLQHSHADQVQ